MPKTAFPLRESAVERLCDHLAEAMGWEVIRLSQRRASNVHKGLPDRRYRSTRYACAIWFEVKAEGGQLTREQYEFLDAEAQCGSVGGVGGVAELKVLLDGARDPKFDLLRYGRFHMTRHCELYGFRGERKLANAA